MPTAHDSASVQGRKLYHDVWTAVKTMFFDRDYLATWWQWEHKFDEQITDRKSARKFVEEMLASLNDPYTKLLPARPIGWESGDEEEHETIVSSGDLGKSIGYLGIISFGQTDVFEQMEAELAKIAHLDGFIINLECNRGGLIDPTANCLELFLETGKLVTIELQTAAGLERREVELTRENFVRTVTIDGGAPEVTLFPRKAPLIANKPVVLMINGETMSAAELFAATLLRNENFIAVGEKSHGKGIGQTLIEYQDGSAIRLSNLRFYSGDDKWIGDCGRTVSNGIEPKYTFLTWRKQVRWAFKELRQERIRRRQTAKQTRSASVAGGGKRA